MEKTTKNNAGPWGYVEIFHQGDAYYSALLADIRRARVSITLETYIFAVDSLTKIILEELAQAKKRGCRVQLLIDGFGSYYWLPALRRQCAQKNIDLRVYHPLPHGLGWFRSFFWMYFAALRTWQLVKKLNHRNHRKITIIDSKRAYLGSLNFTQVHSEKLMGALAWRDTGVAVEGSGVTVMERAFYTTWRQAEYRGLMRLLKIGRRRTKAVRHPLVRLNSTQRLRFQLYRDLRRRIRDAHTEVLVVTAYFLPKRSLLRTLKTAAEKGVRVQLIVPGLSDVPMVRWAAFEMAQTLMKSGVKIYEYQHRILHAKYMLIDDYCSVGSLNLNHRSFLHDLEVEAVLNAPADVQNIRNQWRLDKEQCLELTQEKLMAVSWPLRLLSRIAFKLRYLL